MCDSGWSGSDCRRQALQMTMQTCANNCNANGLCLDGKCICNVGFNGADCAEKTCEDPRKTGPRCDMPRCYNDCGGRGLCMNGKCQCWSGFLGEDCSIPVQCYEQCHSACEADSRSEKCLFCVGQCGTMKSSNDDGSNDIGV